MTILDEIVKDCLEGRPATVDRAMEAAECSTTEQLCEAADRVRRARCGGGIDTCSIVNARSGLCNEDCKWCSQSRHHKCANVEQYAFVDEQECMELGKANDAAGVKRYSLVTSGRAVTNADLDRYVPMYERLGRETGLFLCASMGLIDHQRLERLYRAGVKRYHCNLETAASFFPTLCSTHSREDKLRTIRAAKEVGMEVCSGGIIGMGETMRQRLELIEECRYAGAVSIPINLLNPIPGTPLENQPLLDEEEIVRSVALMRLVAPDTVMRFAGGRLRLSPETTRRILRGGMNGVMIGNLLTTAGNDLDEDRKLLEDCEKATCAE